MASFATICTSSWQQSTEHPRYSLSNFNDKKDVKRISIPGFQRSNQDSPRCGCTSSIPILFPPPHFASWHRILISSHPGYSLIHPLAVAEKDKREEEGTITRNTTRRQVCERGRSRVPSAFGLNRRGSPLATYAATQQQHA